jgi:polyisoprenoid-binding protein YceI
MITTSRLASLCGLALLLLPALAPAANYRQAAGSSLGFRFSYQGQAMPGHFKSFDTRFSFDPAKPAAAVLDVHIPLGSASTGDGEQESTLKSSDFFNVAAFPEARFSAKGVRALGGNRYAADGQLTLRGVSKPVTLTFTWTPGAQPVLAGSATVPRLAFGVGGGEWADTGTIADAVQVSTRVVFATAP